MKNLALALLTGMLLTAVSFAAEELTVAEQQRLHENATTSERTCVAWHTGILSCFPDIFR